MTLRIVEKITYEAAQQPAIATQYDELAVKGNALIMSAFLRHQGQEVDILRGRRRSGDIEPACKQDFLDQIVELRDIAGQFCLDLGIWLRLEQLDAQPYPRPRRAAFVRGVGEQPPVTAAKSPDTGRGAVEACGCMRDPVCATAASPAGKLRA